MNIKRSILSFLFLIVTLSLFGQEYLLPLGCNLNYIYKDLKGNQLLNVENPGSQKPSAASLELPFIEDFFYASTNNYPDASKWSDSAVYINHGYGVAPPSIGVATFDGLNKYGYPYNPSLSNISLTQPADVLTSQNINLFTSSSQTLDPATASVSISFYYQARGNGDSPEVSDSLLLDFYKPWQKKWENVWYSRGNSSPNVNDSIFKYVFVRVNDTAYYHDGFRFRFRNWGSTAGNFDNWNVDYIFLDKNRNDSASLSEIRRKDLTFGQIPSSFLRDYSAMPMRQYQPSEMASNLSVRVRNNSSSETYNARYRYKIYDPSGNLISGIIGGLNLVEPFDSSGYSPHLNEHAFPAVQTTLNLPSGLDSLDYTVKHILNISDTLGTSLDNLPRNDTVTCFQSFRNYYAVDDGGAEAGYYVLGVKAKMAVKIRVNTADTIRALRIYFDPVGYINTISTTYKFKLHVWNDNNGSPGTIFHKDSSFYTPKFINAPHAPFMEYKFDTSGTGSYKVLNPGTYYVGFEQYNATGTITVGFDKNYNHNTALFYDSGNGWSQSALKGSIMLRPVLGKFVPAPVGIMEYNSTNKNLFKVYPNPSSDQFIIASETQLPGSYTLLNSLGQTVKEGLMDQQEQVVSTQELSTGIYFLIIKTNDRIVQQQKIVISR